MPEFLRRRSIQVVTLILAAQAVLLYGFHRTESVPPVPPLAEFPNVVNGWQTYQEGVVDEEVQKVLRADDVLNRTFVGPASATAVNLFIAAFKSQRTGQAPHSPKNCLPGNGWVPSVSQIIYVPIPGMAPVEVNKWVVQKGDDASLVLYWYQSRDRSVASEYKAKFYVAADAIRYNRTDTALIRVVVPVLNQDIATAEAAATRFVQDTFPTIRRFLPS